MKYFTVLDNSMQGENGEGIPVGCALWVESRKKPKAGNLVLAEVKGELVVRRLEITGSTFRLAALNPVFADLEVDSVECVKGVANVLIEE